MYKPNHVAVHPLVLLSVVDHYNRVIGKTKSSKRVVGVLLGESNKGKIDVTNSYAVPFEEDMKEEHVWFFDHNYHETMYNMFKKINAKEKVVGWYTTGTHYKEHDIEINELLAKYCTNPILVIIDVEHSDQLALPTEAYYAIEEVSQNGTMIKSFIHLSSSVEAFEPEEIGVEHLLREIKDISLNSLGNVVQQKVQSLHGMIGKINQIQNYLLKVVQGKIKTNNQIMSNIQEILNLLPNLNQEDLMKAFSSKNNDMMFVLYVCSLARSIISLHTLINNKIQNREQEKKDEKEKIEKTKEKLEKGKEKEKENKDKDKENKSDPNAMIDEKKK